MSNLLASAMIAMAIGLTPIEDAPKLFPETMSTECQEAYGTYIDFYEKYPELKPFIHSEVKGEDEITKYAETYMEQVGALPPIEFITSKFAVFTTGPDHPDRYKVNFLNTDCKWQRVFIPKKLHDLIMKKIEGVVV